MKEQFNILGKIASYFIDKYRVVYLLLLMIIVTGAMAYSNLPREERPEVTRPNIRIKTTYTGVAPEEMESLITDPIEDAINNVEGIVETSSTTTTGSSSITISFPEDYDMDQAVYDVESEVNKVKLPDDASDPTVQFYNTVEMPIMDISISGSYSLIDLKSYAEELQAEIAKINGVSEITLSGGLDSRVFVEVDRHKLDMYGLNINSISQSIETANKDNPIGTSEIDTLEYSVRLIGQFNTIDDVKQVVVADLDGFPIYLSDIANVYSGYADVSSVSERYNSLSQSEKEMVPSVSLSIQRENGADVISASAEIHELIDSGFGSLYPEDLIVTITNEDAVTVNNALDDVINNAISGLLLVIVVLFTFIGFKESVIVAFVIPLSLLISFVCMNLFDLTLNTMSMVALILALGMLVDNAIVIMENIDRVRDEGHDILSASKEATNQVAPAVFAATLTTISAFIPLAFADGTLGQIMSVIPIIVVFAIGASFIMSILVTPALCSRFLSKEKKHKTHKVFTRILSIAFVCICSAYAFSGSQIQWISILVFGAAMTYKQFFSKASGVTGQKGGIIEKYGSVLRTLLTKKIYMALGLVLCAVIFFASILTITSGRLPIELIPKQDSTTLTISTSLPDGYLLEDALAIGEQIESKVFQYPEVQNIVSSLSKSSVSYTLEVVDESERTLSSTELIDKMRNDLSDIAGFSFTVGQKTRGFRSSSPVKIEILGDDSDSVAKVADDFMQILKNVEGATEVTSSLTGGPPELQIVVDDEKASLYGLNRQTIATAIKQNISGTEATTMVLNGEDVAVEIWFEDSRINTVTDFSSITFENNAGTTIYFDQVADIVETKGLQSITHQDMKRTESVSSQITDEYTATQVLDNFMQAVENYDLPKNVYVNYAGESRDISETFTNLFVNMAMAILMVFIILAVQFNSLTQPLAVLFAIPLAAIGAIWGLIITGNNFSTYAFFGIVSLVGIAVNDAIVLIDYFNYLRREEGMEITEAIIEGGKTRFIPVFSTTITTIGGILPLALRDVEYAQLGYSLIFGLLVATVLTLVVIPMIYLSFESAKIKVRKYVPIMVDVRS